MGKKKKLKKKLKEFMKNNLNPMAGMGYQQQYGNGFGPGNGNGYGNGFGLGNKKDFLNSLGQGLGNVNNQQFVIGLLLGAAGAFVLGDKNLRDPMMKWAVKMYSEFIGGFEEFKEQMADLKAEADYKNSEKK